jgi:hypothetical protein
MAEKAKNDAPAAPREATLGGCRRNVMRALTIVLVFLFGIFLMRFGVLDFILGGDRPPIINLTSVLERVQLVSELTTVRYTYSNIITVERDLPPLLQALYRDRLVLVAVGHVTAGIDLSKLTEDDVRVEGNIINVSIPAPELFDCFFNEPDSYVASRETGLFTAPAPDLDLDARMFAIRQFRNAALEKGILTEAAQEAENVLANLIGAFYPDSTVVVTVKEAEGQVIMPDTCGGN